MGNQDHVAILKQGVEAWNQWRSDNPEENPDLSDAKLRGEDLAGANLSGADLRQSDLSEARLWFANLSGADLYKANLRRAQPMGAHLSDADVTGVKFSRSTLQRNFQGIRVATCYGSQQFKTFAQDQDYIEELRSSGFWRNKLFWIWWLFANCGRSFLRWAAWSILFAIGFALIYWKMGPEHFSLKDLPFEFHTLLYYSVVTFTTLGFGDITPKTPEAARWVMAEVVLGYIMLGGLISILANKLARRA